ncbi:MAG: hypothetical protein RL071_949 [Pseudomonadota bacterium]|jgi:polyphosphate kinase
MPAIWPAPCPPALQPRRGGPQPAADDPAALIDRELSLIQFHRRVLAQAQDPGVPLLERLRFLTIVSRIVDEFYEVRVAGLLHEVELGRRAADGADLPELLRRVSAELHELIAEQYRHLNSVLLPALADEGILLRRRTQLNPAQRRWVEAWFEEQALPVLTPLGLDLSHPFPTVQNKALSFIVGLDGKDAFGRGVGLAVVQVPRCLPRLIRLPPELCQARHEFVMISSVIHANVEKLFPGMRVRGCHQFRVTRNSDLWVDEEEEEDLLRAIQLELPRRNFGDAVRLEVADTAEDHKVHFLLNQFGLDERHLFRVNGPVNLNRLAALYDMVDRPDLKFRPFTPSVPSRVTQSEDIFRTISEGELLLHHPYQSFGPVTELLRQAAADSDVLAIKMTLYRTVLRSPVVEALIEAARNGKAVTAVIELRARFDEEDNIQIATRLKEAGASVVYGIVGFKAHAKVLLVVRREGGKLRRYVHLGTGNYHPGTSKAYTDISFMTADPAMGADVHTLFNQLTGIGVAEPLQKLLQSPFTLARAVTARVDAEAEAARAGRSSGIALKLNALVDPALIAALYRASQAGVPIRLKVRGMCRLRPGVPGLSETIQVHSTVGRFLEHTRCYWFHAEGDEVMYLASADWMERNLYRRVEVAFPIEDHRLKQRLRTELFELYDRDDTQTWVMLPDGTSRKRAPVGPRPFSAQDHLLELHTRRG